MLKKLTVTALALVFSASLVFGSGFSIYEQGAKATAMSGAFAAQANDVTAIFYNPAGITSLNGFQVGFGIDIIMPHASFTGPTSTDPNLYSTAEDQVFTPVTFYTSYQINDKMNFGFGFFTPFGLGSTWDDGWAGRYLATNTQVQTFFLNPVFAYKVMDNFSVAIGFNYAFGSVTMEKMINFPVNNSEVHSKLEADGNGMGWNIGLQYKPTEEMSIGFAYRSNVMLEFKDGDATFDLPVDETDPMYPIMRSTFPNTKGSADLELPTIMTFGVSYDFTDQLTAEFDYVVTGWDSYDKLTVTFDDPVGGKTESTSEKNYQNSASLRLGLEYRLNDDFALRGGYMRDNHAVPDKDVEPSLPEGDRDIYNFGFGYKMGAITIDGYYMLLMQKDREITNSVHDFNGTYKSVGNLYGLSFGYAF